MSLLRRVIRPSYRPIRVIITLMLLALLWFVSYENIKKNSVEFFKSLQQESLLPFQSAVKSGRSENSRLFELESTDSISSFENNLLKPEGLGDEGFEDNLLKAEGFVDNLLKPEGFEDNLLKPEGFEDNLLKPEGFEDNILKPEGFEDEGNVNLTKREGKKEENAITRRLRIRREKVLEVCRSGKVQGFCKIKTVLNFRMYFFHRYDTSVCTVAKSASSTWRAHLRRVNKGPRLNKPIDDDNIRKAFLQRPIEDIEKDVKSSSKILTVRHPLTRLVSAFRNKYNDGKTMPPHRPRAEVKVHKRIAGSYWHDRFHQFWLPALFANNMVPPNIHLKVGMKAPVNPNILYSKEEYERLYRVLKPKVSFVQFLKYALKTYEKGKPDAHWKPYYDNCCPCHFDYEYITKVETLTEDLEYIFKKLGIPANPNTSKNQRRKSVDNTHSYYGYYRNVPTTLRREIYKYLKPDMDLFGYELPTNFLI